MLGFSSLGTSFVFDYSTQKVICVWNKLRQGHKSRDKEDRLRIKMKKFAIILDKSERLVYNKCIAWLHRGNVSKVHERANAIWRDWIW